ncbi:LamB/YcsF family protein [Ornithinibacillus massiliensis]|uniref:5-oxoprolinase subunit A n=1 Tax=Ornithinibacillus massiliensis TaxID=1944633 RepID=A0ABS5MIG2_9BACI|nr:5-oxoprolinase subunit PxpA [Ornithinibacillus massiliensis]MBS3681892.1 LamB/YcsF family protein [Ornithinibacillus massiliensis]
MQRRQIDLNCDMGEGFGAYQLGNDDDVIKLVSSVNIACGYHGGDPDVMDHTVAMANKYNVGIGAHPGFPNLLGFGRWNMDIPSKTLTNLIIYQIGALDIFCRKHGVTMQHVKPHGNLNNMADTDTMIATSIVDAVQSINPKLPIYVKPNSELEKVANEKGQPIVLELFADRAYNKDLTLVPRCQVGAVITDPHQVAVNVLKMVTENYITTITGEKIAVEGQTICVHGDTPSAVEMIRVIREKLEENQIMIASSNY